MKPHTILATAGLLMAVNGNLLWGAPSAAYRLDQTVVGSVGDTGAAGGKCLRPSGGEAVIGQSYSTHYSIQAGYLCEYFQPAPTPTPAPQIANASLKTYHNQINPTRGEEAVIRWSQPKTGAVTITIYNLLGDKAAVPVDNQSYASGQYHEATWDGLGPDGKAVGSGIYIVHLKTDGFESRSKIAVIK